MENPQTTDDRLCISVPSAARAVGLSKSLIYDLIGADRFPHVHFGAKRITVPIAALQRYIEEKAAEGQRKCQGEG